MREDLRPVTLSTIADLARHGYRLHVHCDACARTETLRAAALVEAGHGAREFIGLRFRCTACGGPAGAQLAPPT